MNARLKKLGVVLAALGLVFVAGGVFAYSKVAAGADALQAFSAAQNVTLAYDENGNYLSHGTAEEGATILAMLQDEWKYPVNLSEINPDDPLVNTGSEYMLQMATVVYHTLHATARVTLPDDADDVVYDGVTYHAGDTVEFVNDGKYWTGFDRSNVIEGLARDKVWTGTAHALVGELGVGSVTASTLQMGYGIAALIAGIGCTSILAGLGLVWVASAAPVGAQAPTPAAKPQAKAENKNKK
jgi:hypothetical protein